MKLVERHYLKSNQELIDITHKSKNIYNLANYYIRQHYIQTSQYVNYQMIDKIMQKRTIIGMP